MFSPFGRALVERGCKVFSVAAESFHPFIGLIGLIGPIELLNIRLREAGAEATTDASAPLISRRGRMLSLPLAVELGIALIARSGLESAHANTTDQ